MPGIYVNDGGQISSTLGNILGGIATNMDPKTQAEAQELRQRVMQEDLNNQILRGRIAGATGIPGVLAAGHADPTTGQSGVAGTLAGAAVPPDTGPAPGTFGGSTVNAGYSPYAKVLSGSYLNDPSMGNFSTGINLGQGLTTGPGTDLATQTDIAKQKAASDIAIAQAKAVPYNTTPDITHHVPGGALPETTVQTGDAGAVEAEKQQRAKDVSDANQQSALGATAAANLGELQRLNQIYDTLVNTPDTSDLRGVIGDEALKFIAAKTGIDVTKISSRIGAMQAIQSRMNQMLGSAIETVQPDTPIRGILSAVKNSLPDPTTMTPEQYRGAVAQLQRGLQSQADEAGPANVFKNSGFSKADADAYHNALAAVRDRNNKAFAAQPEPGAGGSAGGGTTLTYPDRPSAEAAASSGHLPRGTKVRIANQPGTFTVGD